MTFFSGLRRPVELRAVEVCVMSHSELGSENFIQRSYWALGCYEKSRFFTEVMPYLSNLFNQLYTSFELPNKGITWAYFSFPSIYPIFVFILQTLEGSHMEAYQDFQPNLTSSAVSTKCCLDHRLHGCTPSLHGPIANSVSTQSQHPAYRNQTNVKG